MNIAKHHSSKFNDDLSSLYQRYIPSNAQINSKSESQYLKERIEQFRNKINELRIEYYKQQKTPLEYQKMMTWNKAFSKYFKIYNRKVLMELDGGGPHSQSRTIIFQEEWLQHNLKFLSDTIEKAHKNIDNLAFYHFQRFYGELQSDWDIRFSNKILKQISTLDNDQIDVLLFYLALIRRGILFIKKNIGTNANHYNWVNDPDICYSIIFAEAFNNSQAIVGAILPERLPITFNDDKKLTNFKYQQYILFTEFMDQEQILNQKQNFVSHKQDIIQDADRFQCFQYANVNLKRDAPKYELHIHTQYKHLFTGDVLSYQIRPLKIFNWMVKEPSVDCFEFNQESRRWIQTKASIIEQKVDKRPAIVDSFANNQIMNKLDTEKYTEQLVKILDLMPTLKIKLSHLQQLVVSSNQNLLCLGRSGTGKTTTSVLRLFAQEIMYITLNKQRVFNQQKKLIEQNFVKDDNKKEKIVLHSTDLSSSTGMKLVFITASPVLTNEVRRFYKNLKLSLESHLLAKEQKKQQLLQKQQKQQEEKKLNFEEIKQSDPSNTNNIQQQDNDDEIEIIQDSIEDQEKKELLDFIRNEEKLLIEDTEMDGQLFLPNRFDQLDPQNFPLFVTVKKLIYMIDACMSYSFFSRDSRGNIVGMDSNLGWHNETKGVMMINHYYKENIDYDEQLAKFGLEMMQLDKEVEIMNEEEENLKDHGSNFFISQDQQKKYQQNFFDENKFTNFYSGSKFNEKYILERQQLSFEVDFDVFEQKFWPKIAQRKHLKKFSPTLVWTEIYSVIKGGMKSQSYYMGYLPKNVYINVEASDFLNLVERRTVYYIFLEYEKWKQTHNAFDFMDVVNHISKRLWYGGERLRRLQMDYLMVDEVQDLTPKTLQLLLNLTNHNVFFAGDTAQTIAKGVSARFLDLRHIFHHLDYSVPKIVQLTKNYRSHGRILDLANSVVDLIELYFPKTIDKLAKEESDLDGMKPLIIMPLDNNSLKTMFLGTNISQKGGENSPQFGCNQVLIVRDQEAKNQVPEIFKNMLCLSIYEAKGLEFEDVILYNFFHLGEVNKSQWKLLNDIMYEKVKKVKYSDEILDFNSLDVSNFEEFKQQMKFLERQAVNKEDYDEDFQLSTKKERDVIYKKFSMLCIELKFLYVAITRPKRRLIIYDDISDFRRPIQNYWEHIGFVNVVTKDMLLSPETLSPDVRQIFETGALQKDRSSADDWRIQGIKLFKKKYYDAAIKCFQFSEDDDLVKRCYAYLEAETGNSLQSEADSMIWRSKALKYISKFEKKKMVKDAKKIRTVCYKHFENAGNLFEQIKMFKHAGSCFYTAKNYSKAAEIFEGLEYFGQAAECLVMENQLQKAAKLYEKAKLISRAIDCYESAGEWELLLHCLHRNKEFFKAEERESLVNKYVPVALNCLYKLYSQEDDQNELDEENKGKMQEMKIKLKYQKKVNVIVEEEEEELLSSGGSDEENDDQQEEKKSSDENIEEEDKVEQEVEEQKNEEGNKEEIQNDGQKEEEEDKVSDKDEEEEIDLLEEVFQLKKMKSQQDEEKNEQQSKDQSFQIITSSDQNKVTEQAVDAQQDQNNEDDKQQYILNLADEFEHLSQYDPDDEFLSSGKSVSIIESILSKKSISQTSEFSIITQNQAKDNSIISMCSKKSKSQIAVIQSNRDIYAEDVITQKIIYYISLFSGEVSEHLAKLRSQKVLFSNPQKQQIQQEAKELDFLIDLDDVDSEFVNLILDVLEYYELFRLCLMICNRYHMSDRLGRYLVSVCSKYSNMQNHRFRLDLLKLTHFNKNWKERQRQSSIIAHEAIHNVFTLIEPKFLSLKNINEQLTKENSMGIDTYRIMLDLGFWKKLIFILPGEMSLQLCKQFIDRDSYHLLLQLLKFEKEEDKIKAQSDYKKIILKSLQMEMIKKVWGINLEVEQEEIFKNIREEQNNNYNAEKDEQEQIEKVISLYEILYKVTKKTDTDKKLYDKELQKIKERDRKEILKTKQKAEQIFQQIQFNNNEKDQYFTYFMAFQFILSQLSPQHSQIFKNVRTFFDKELLKNLIEVFLKALKIMNMQITNSKMKLQQNEIILEALYSTFLISQINNRQCQSHDNTCQSCCIFKQYKTNYLLVNVNSPIFNEILEIQQNIDKRQINLFVAEQLQDLRPKYFRVYNFKQAFVNQVQDFMKNLNLRKAILTDKSESAFILDMDAQFIMVPKVWIDKILVQKLVRYYQMQNLLQLQQSIQFSKELKNKAKYFLNKLDDNSGKMNSIGMALRYEIENQFQILAMESQIMDQVNQLITESVSLHDQYGQKLTNEMTKLYNTLYETPDFKELMLTYWKKCQFNCLQIKIVSHENQKDLNPFTRIEHQFKLIFNLGITHKKQYINGMNMILQQGFVQFKMGLEKNIDHIIENYINKQEEDDMNIAVKNYRFQKLLKSLVYFVLADKYEYLVELIKAQLKTGLTEYKDKNDVQFLLKKFMIALDIHVYLKENSWSLAADSIFQFLNTFYSLLTLKDKAQLIQTAFYLLTISKFGMVYIPDYVSQMIIDINYNLNQYYDFSMVDYAIGKQKSYQGDERILIDLKIDNLLIEKLQNDGLYHESLYWVNKLLKDLNEDEKSSAKKGLYKRMYNILITACINDPKKSDKTYQEIINGFNLLTQSPFDEYFLQTGLQSFDYTKQKGINQVYNDFLATQDEYKWEFFTGSDKNYGHFIMFLDVRSSQSKEISQKISQNLDKLYNQENKVIASHYYFGIKLKKLIKNKKEMFRRKIQESKKMIEERQFVKALNIPQILLIEQLPTKKILQKINKIIIKQVTLRQMIVCKYATNSQDLHYILSKGIELDNITSDFLTFIQNYINQKGTILMEYVDIGEDLLEEIYKRMNEVQSQIDNLQKDVQNWMERKAEPNLIEVERKNKKYKIKWDSLSLSERKQRLIAIKKKEQYIIESLQKQ